MSTYYGHSDLANPTLLPDHPGANWQLLSDHLQAVAELARAVAREANPNDESFHAAAWWAGLLHDLGKYLPAFQQMLLNAVRGEPREKVPHAVYGGAIAALHNAHDVALAVDGHHAGLPDLNQFAARVKELMEQAEALWAIAKAPGELALLEPPPPYRPTDKLEADLRIRMLHSCLVDADRRDTAEHAGRARSARDSLPARELLDALLAHVSRLAANAPEGTVKQARQEVLKACLAAAERAERLQTLSVPTGGGKTLASMAFALKRAAMRPDEVRRIFVVIPFLSIIEQNAEVYRRVFGDLVEVFEHHSGNPLSSTNGEESSELLDRKHQVSREMEEDWDAPIVVTTSVRFFDSLFSCRPRDLRRVHNIARSVVIFDEVQTVPREMLAALLDMMRRLSEQWSTTFLLCTATQPAFERPRNVQPEGDSRWEPGTSREIIESPRQLYRTLERVEVEWPDVEAPSPTWDDIAARIAREPRALCIVNTKQHARDLCELVRRQTGGAVSCWHLSTRLCAQHRLQVLADIKEALMASGPVLVISTQLVEAGVDIDFPVVFRQLAPLDAVVQAAGRCDREGRLTAAKGRPGGRVVVFDPEGSKHPKGVYGDGIGIVASMLRQDPALDAHEPSAVSRYFHQLYGPGSTDTKAIQDLRKNLLFRKVSEEFAMICEATRAVYIPYDATAVELIGELQDRLVFGGPKREVLRRLQRYQVGLYAHELVAARRAGTIRELDEDGEWLAAREACYDADFGLLIGDTSYLPVV